VAIQEPNGARRLLDRFAIARPEGRASFDALWLAMTILVRPNRIVTCRFSSPSCSRTGAAELSVGSFRFRAATDRELTGGSLDVQVEPGHFCEQIDIHDPDRASAERHVGRHQVKGLRQHSGVL
jgi:hypothetical protein